MKRGSITVFSALCMSFVLSALFVLLEAARFYGLSRYADWKGKQSVECVAAEYQPYLWEEFELLMLDGGYSTDFFEIGNVTGRMKTYLDKNQKQSASAGNMFGINLFQVETSHIYEPQYLLITDNDGEVFLDMISSYMKKNLPREAAEKIRENYVNQNDIKNHTARVEDTIDHANQSMESAKTENPESVAEIQPLEENPLDVAGEIRKSMKLSTLGLVVENAGDISTKRMNLAEELEKRTLC